MLYGRRLREILRERWDLVHCWEEPFILAGGQVSWWTPRQTPLVFWTAQNLFKRYPPPFSWVEGYSLNRCTGWVACGESIVETLLPRGYDRRPYRIIPLGVDLDQFHPDSDKCEETRRQLGWVASGPPVVGFLGRFVPEKGVKVLTRVLDAVSVPWRMLFVGGGQMEPYLRTWGARYGDSVRVVTGIAHDEVPAYLNVMDILCAPSQTMPNWREQLGRMLIEAFACGVPVIASDSGEMPYVVKDAGVMVRERDEKKWARELAELLENPARRAELSARGIERAREVYAWPVIARQHLDFFSELLEISGNAKQ